MDKSTQGLVIALLVVSAIPAFFTIGGGISGMVVNDMTSYTSNDIGNTMIWIYFFIAFAILALAIAYTILLFREDSKKKDTKKTSKIKSGQDTKSALSKLHPNKGHIKLSDEDAGRYIVAAVGIVGFIAILMIIIG